MKYQKKIAVMNHFDEMGIMKGLGHWSEDGKTLLYIRYPGETNKELRDRIWNAGRYISNATKQGIVNNLSRDLLCPRYDCYDRTIYYTNEDPWPSPTGVHVYVSGLSTNYLWQEYLPQVRASGYAAAASGWILWNLPDESGSHGVLYGAYTRVLEFIGTSQPSSGDAVRIEYLVKTGTDEIGRPLIATRSDFDHPLDDEDQRKFHGENDAMPTGYSDYRIWLSGHIAVYSIDELAKTPASSIYYTSEGAATDYLVELKRIVEDEYPMRWGRFKWDTVNWDCEKDLADGTLPSLHDAEVLAPTGFLSNESGWYEGGVEYGPDLYCNGIEVVGSGSSQKWYPKLYPGQFYIGTSGFCLFEKEHRAYLTLAYAGQGLYSGYLPISAGPQRLETLALQYSGYGGMYLPGNQIGRTLSNVSGITELFAYVNDTSGSMYRQIPFLSGKAALYETNTYLSGYYTYDYDTGCVMGSGIGPKVQIAWEDPGASGMARIISGVMLDLCPIANDQDRIYFIRR